MSTSIPAFPSIAAPAETPLVRAGSRPPKRGSKPKVWGWQTWGFAEWFILSQTFLPALLYLPGTQPLRIPIRMASYGISLGALIWYLLSNRGRAQILTQVQPAVPWLLGAMIYICLMLFHPETQGILAGVAQIGLYFSILAPVLWARSCVPDLARLNRLLWLLFICNGVNAFVGVMQVRSPDFWMPHEFSSVLTESEFGLGTVLYEGADGRYIIRPPGLSDLPGAVCGPAMFALFLGLVFSASAERWWKKLLAGILVMFAAAAIFLSLVRSSFLIAVGMTLLFVVIQVAQGRLLRAGQLLLVGTAAIFLAFAYSSATGGESLVQRFESILEENPVDFYYENRGNQVESGLKDLLPTYPLGAGLGRWGMINSYFGNPANSKAPPIWVEVQLPAWIVDGGFILLLLYPAALLVTLWQQAKLVFWSRDRALQQTATVIFASNVGLLALCFSYAVFASPVGLQFWFLTGALHSVAIKRRHTLQKPLPLTKVIRRQSSLTAA